MIRCTMDQWDSVYEILTDPNVYDWITDDGSTQEGFDQLLEIYLTNESVVVLMPNDFSVFLAIPMNAITYDVHTNVLPEGRGKKAIRAAIECTSWMFDNTPCQKLNTWVPANNDRAKMFASLCGMKIEGINRLSFLKNGKLYDQFLMGLTKGEWLCQQQ